MLEQLIEDMEKGIRDLRQWPNKVAQIFHHNDADGLCSGSILTRAFERQGYDVRRFCLEKPYPAVLKKIYAQDGGLIVFADFAGRIAPMLSQLNKGRNLTLILDHHAAEASTDPNVYNLDPDLYGLKGDRDISASTTCYLFARIFDPANHDMAHIAALGAVGDQFFVEGRLVGQNRDVTMEAVQQGTVEIREHESGEQYILKSGGNPILCDDLSTYLSLLGSAGYYRNGPEMGIRVCIEGIFPDSDRMMETLKVMREKAFDEEIQRIERGALNRSSHIQWFHVQERFYPMGVKTIGDFCSMIRNLNFVDPEKYVAGFQVIPPEIPDFGTLMLNDVKISMRVSEHLEGEIRAGRAMGLNVLLPEATDRLGGFSDACHTLSAATTVAKGKEQKLIDEMEKILKGFPDHLMSL